ncbi:hypothetical protein GCM10011379_21390 [Filimonas zeae]|uniref:Sulfatase-modifying factor enzyme-like domain-containing protein n=2 Tax=Filimonas zeae TaxID=1737353 RepID=A0A917IYI7_9BACT|nr:hypothetical protein GCM10011379_21390 [Filimonas zeae]
MLSGAVFAQRNPARIRQTMPLGDSMSMNQCEVAMLEWMWFIVNNDFREDLFPDPSALSQTAALFFDDLKSKRFAYLKVVDNSKHEAIEWDYKTVRLIKRYEELEQADSIYFSARQPVAGISFAQAKLYCAWREKVLNRDRSRRVNIKVSLPDIDVYRKVADNVDSVCGSKRCDSCKRFSFNYFHAPCKLAGYDKGLAANGQRPARIDYFWPVKAGFYNIQGNVAEMTSVEGVAFGGSFRHYAIESHSDHTQSYTKPEDWLGFRCMFTATYRYSPKVAF